MTTAHSLAVILLCMSAAVIVAYAIHVVRSGRAKHARLGPSPGSALLPGWLVEAFYWAMHAPARALVSLGVSPDALTYASLAFCVASLPLTATGRFAEAALVIVVGAALDAMDGMVARARGVDSPSGAVLDSFADRLADAAPLAGLVIFYRHHTATLVVPLAAMVGTSLVSYARARADAHGLVLPNGLMRRHERVVYLCASLLSALLVPEAPQLGGVRAPLLLFGVALVALVSFAASLVLVARTRQALRSSSSYSSGPAVCRVRAPLREPTNVPLEHRG